MENNKYINKNQYEILQEKFNELKKSVIHVSLTKGRNKVDNAVSKIKGVYPRFVCVTSKVNNYEEDFTISYTDILTKIVKIKELSI